MIRRDRKAKIVATIGPSTSHIDILEKLFKAGVDVFRLNFSHGTFEEHRQRLEMIRAVEEKLNRPIGILLDLQGPKLRIGTFENGAITLNKGDRFRLELDPNVLGNQQKVSLPHPEIFEALIESSELLLDDGRIRLKVEKCDKYSADTRVIFGGTLSDRKGVNVPGVVLPLSAMTEKDHQDLKYGLSLGVDWVALSFVQKAQDIEAIQQLVQGRAGIVAKIEKPAAIDQLDAIIAQTDAIMVARGDLGVELPAEQVPSVQKLIVRACRAAGKPVIVATQMLDSMVNAPLPTRAEASDVATAIYDGTDAVMLSAESAVGNYPIESVQMMNNIIKQVEKDPLQQQFLNASHTPEEPHIADAICGALRGVATLLPISVTVAYTSSGYSTLRAARERPASPILSLTPLLKTARRLALVWGVHSVQKPDVENLKEMVEHARRAAQDYDFAKTNDCIIIIAGVPFGNSGTTNLLHIIHV